MRLLFLQFCVSCILLNGRLSGLEFAQAGFKWLNCVSNRDIYNDHGETTARCFHRSIRNGDAQDPQSEVPELVEPSEQGDVTPRNRNRHTEQDLQTLQATLVGSPERDPTLSHTDVNLISLDMWDMIVNSFDMLGYNWRNMDLDLMMASVRMHLYEAMESKTDSPIPFFPSKHVPAEVPRKTIYRQGKFLDYGYSGTVWKVVSRFIPSPVAAKVMSPFAVSRMNGAYASTDGWAFTNLNEIDYINGTESVFSRQTLSEIVAALVAKRQLIKQASMYLVQPYGVFIAVGLGIDLLQRSFDRVPGDLKSTGANFRLCRQVVRTVGPNQALRVHLWMELLDITFDDRSLSWKERNKSPGQLEGTIDLKSMLFEIIWGEYSLFTKEGIIMTDNKLSQFGFKYMPKRRVYSIGKHAFKIESTFMPRRFDLGTWEMVNSRQRQKTFLANLIKSWNEWILGMKWKVVSMENVAHELLPGPAPFKELTTELLTLIDSSHWHHGPQPDIKHMSRLLRYFSTFGSFLSPEPSRDIEACRMDPENCELFIM